MDTSPVLTDDGSHTLYSTKFDATYHSTHGAIAESQHVFIQAGLDLVLNNTPDSIRILEYGFGTGLNCLLTFDFLRNKNIKVHYTTLELYPIDNELISDLNYTSEISNSVSIFDALHSASWNEPSVLSKFFTLEKRKVSFTDYIANHPYDLVYYDAFAPSTQAELWDEKMMTHIGNNMVTGGILTTYCAKGSFKRALKSSGFAIESIPGPIGKREMTRATKV